MALLRKFFYRKPPDGLLEISDRVYVFDCCFTTDILEDDEYKVYIGGIVSQLREHSPDASFMVFNFREGDNQSQITSILSDYDMTVIDYPRHHEGCPFLTMEMIHHFLRSSESWLSLGQQNVLMMHCERGGWPVLAFVLAALLIYRKQFTGEQQTLDMIYKQAPRELLQLMSPLNPLPSQLRYLQYVSRRNVGSQWPPLDRALTLDCIILRVITNIDGEGGCRPMVRIYGSDPLMASDRTPKVLFSASKWGKHVQHYKQADSDLIKLDIHCHVQGDVVMECISLHSDQEREKMMFRVMFNTAFIRSNILMLNQDEIDTLWNTKDHFPKDFRVEVLFSEVESGGSLASIELPTLEEKDGLPMEAFATVQEIFSNMDWLEMKPNVATNVLQHDIAVQEKLDPGSPQGLLIDPVLLESTLQKVQAKLQLKEEENHSESPRTDSSQIKSYTSHRPSSELSSTSTKVEPEQSEFAVLTMFSTKPSSDVNMVQKKAEPQLQIAYQWPAQPKIISERVPQTSLSSPASSCSSSQGSPVHTSRYQAPLAIGITALLHDDSPSNGDGVVRPVTVSLPSSGVTSPIANIPKSVQLSHVSSPRLPPPPPPAPTLLFQSTLEVTDSLVNEIFEVSSSSTNSPTAPPSSSASSSPTPTTKSSSLAPFLTPPPLSSFSGGSQLSAIDKSPPTPSISEPSSSPTIDSSSLTASSFPRASPSSFLMAPPAPPPPSFPRASSSSFSVAPPPAPPPPSFPRASSSSFSVAPPPAPPPPSVPRASLSSLSMAPPPPITPSVSCSGSSSQPVNKLAIPEPLVPLHSGSAMGLGSAAPVPPPPPPSKSVQKDSLSIKSAQPPPVPPPAPFARGLSKATSASPPAHSGVSNGNAPSVPGPPPCVPFNAKGRSLSRTSLRNQGQPRKANLKPYHWLKLTRAMQGSLWAEAQKSDEASKAPEFDMSELESLFSVTSPSSGPVNTGGKSNSRSSGAKSEKVQLIELRRAYNSEIMLSKVKVPLGDLTSSVLALDESALDVDQVDNLIKFCPTKEEMDLLKGYNGDKENLGKCEQFFLELMKVPRVESKLRVFSFKLQFHHQVSDLRSNLNTINSASEEIRGSVKLKRIMQAILSLGNALNQGTARGSAVGFRLDSLLKLTDTRARNKKMTLMHYLCKVLAEKLPELLDFPKDLGSLEAATKIQLKYLAEEMQAINKGLEKVVQELTASENDGPVSETFHQTLKAFLSCAESEVRSLASIYSNVGRNADALALYFGEDPARCPFEQVVSTLLNFVRMFVRAHEENCKQLEIEKKKAEKDAENEKLKMGVAKEAENLIRTPIRSGNI